MHLRNYYAYRNILTGPHKYDNMIVCVCVWSTSVQYPRDLQQRLP